MMVPYYHKAHVFRNHIHNALLYYGIDFKISVEYINNLNDMEVVRISAIDIIEKFNLKDIILTRFYDEKSKSINWEVGSKLILEKLDEELTTNTNSNIQIRKAYEYACMGTLHEQYITYYGFDDIAYVFEFIRGYEISLIKAEISKLATTNSIVVKTHERDITIKQYDFIQWKGKEKSLVRLFKELIDKELIITNDHFRLIENHCVDKTGNKYCNLQASYYNQMKPIESPKEPTKSEDKILWKGAVRLLIYLFDTLKVKQLIYGNELDKLIETHFIKVNNLEIKNIAQNRNNANGKPPRKSDIIDDIIAKLV